MLYLYILKHSLQNFPQWNDYLYLPFSASNNTQIIIRKDDFGCWIYAALSDVHCHEEFPKSFKVMPSHKMQI
jgi:hypothetical protein